MTIYFYDDKACALTAMDTESKTARILPQAMLGSEPLAVPLLQDHLHVAPKASAQKPKRAKLEAPGKGKKGCSICRVPGHNSKTCPDKGQRVPKGDGSLPRGEISQMVFGRIKIAQSHDLEADVIARNLSVPLEEVKKAFKVEAYNDYLEL